MSIIPNFNMLKTHTCFISPYDEGKMWVHQSGKIFCFVVDTEGGNFGIEVNDMLDGETPTFEGYEEVSPEYAKEHIQKWQVAMANRLKVASHLVDGIIHG